MKTANVEPESPDPEDMRLAAEAMRRRGLRWRECGFCFGEGCHRCQVGGEWVPVGVAGEQDL